MLDALGQADLAERTLNQAACRQETALKHPSGISGDSDAPRLEGLEGKERGIR